MPIPLPRLPTTPASPWRAAPWRLPILLLLASSSAVTVTPPAPSAWADESDQAATPPWHHVLAWLGDQRDAMSDDLTGAHAALVTRAENEDAAQLERLSPKPPTPRRTGYGLLPEIKPDATPRHGKPSERRYSIEVISTAYTRDMRDAAVLRAETAEGALPPLVDELKRLRKRLRNLEEHIDYHEFWQDAVVDQGDFFAERNRIVSRVREMDELQRENREPERAAELRRGVRADIAPFRRAPQLRIVPGDEGQRLPVVVHTDIEDAAFLETFQDAVEAAWAEADACRALGLTVDLELHVHPPAELYPDGAPEVGAKIDTDEHLARFPEGSLVLTTGADSTHAWQGRAVLLGTAAVTRSTLAHEFGHLLGFSDGYLRGYEGDPDGRFGVILVEWTGLIDDLMGNTRGGVVTTDLLETLREHYAP